MLVAALRMVLVGPAFGQSRTLWGWARWFGVACRLGADAAAHVHGRHSMAVWCHRSACLSTPATPQLLFTALQVSGHDCDAGRGGHL